MPQNGSRSEAAAAANKKTEIVFFGGIIIAVTVAAITSEMIFLPERSGHSLAGYFLPSRSRCSLQIVCLKLLRTNGPQNAAAARDQNSIIEFLSWAVDDGFQIIEYNEASRVSSAPHGSFGWQCLTVSGKGQNDWRARLLGRVAVVRGAPGRGKRDQRPQ